MGRQIQIHAFPSDINGLIARVDSSGSTEMAMWMGAAATPEPIAFLPDHLTGKTIALWTNTFAPNLQRGYVADAQPPYHVMDVNTEHVLELSLSGLTSWNGKDALTQGRIYAIFDGKQPEFERWYDKFIRHIRRSWTKNPVGWMGGYVGPAAMTWFERGGILLPNYVPPLRSDWIQRLSEQHSL
jgi:hypothetical protein